MLYTNSAFLLKSKKLEPRLSGRPVIIPNDSLDAAVAAGPRPYAGTGRSKYLPFWDCLSDGGLIKTLPRQYSLPTRCLLSVVTDNITLYAQTGSGSDVPRRRRTTHALCFYLCTNVAFPLAASLQLVSPFRHPLSAQSEHSGQLFPLICLPVNRLPCPL